MARDYKHRARKRQRAPEAQGWQWGLSGLALGLLVALMVYLHDRRPGGPAAPAPVRADPASAALEVEAEDDDDVDDASEFSFYELLPKFEVVIPEQERDVRADAAHEPVIQPGSYVLQAGSFRTFGDADRRRAEIALQGIESRIQKVTIDNDQTWHRVRIGPVSDLGQLTRWRERLRDAEIEALIIRVGD